MAPSAREQLEAVRRGTVDMASAAELEKKLLRGKPLRVKLGVDPTAPDIHLGHTVVLRKLRQFQDLGHQAVLIIGDFTALIGDPTGKKKTRPPLTEEEVEAHARTYQDQAGRVLDMKRLELVRNSDWLKGLSFRKLLELTSKFTIARLLERDDFSKRHKGQVPIHLHEFLYVLMQAYDSVEVRADVEIGGTDQTFNLLAGRDLMRDMGLEPQVTITTPILPGTDGVEKMSKSLGNHIGVNDDAYAMYGKTMSIPDAAMKEWFTLLLQEAPDAIATLCDPAKTHPKAAKDQLARRIVTIYHGEPAANDAAARFDVEHRQGKATADAARLEVSERRIEAVKLVVLTGVAKSNGEAKRLIEQGGVDLNGARITDPRAVLDLPDGGILRVGKKNGFFQIVLK